MCAIAREWQCWHSIGFDGAELSDKLASAICNNLSRLDEIDEQFASLVRAAHEEDGFRDVDGWRQLERDEALCAKEVANVQSTMSQAGPVPIVLEASRVIARLLSITTQAVRSHRDVHTSITSVTS